MKKTTLEAGNESGQLRRAVAETMALLDDAGKQLHAILEDDFMMSETPLEVQSIMESAALVGDERAIQRKGLRPC